jgi:uncharacterized membrane protein
MKAKTEVTKAIPVVTVIALLLIPAVALAADEVQQVWWQVLVGELLKVFVLIAVPVLSTLVAVLLRRWGVKIETEQVEKLASAAAGWAEQKALEALKDGKPKTSGADKMKLAIDFANGAVEQYGLKKKAIGKLQELIEAQLGKEQVKAAAAATNGTAPGAHSDVMPGTV